MSWGRYISFVPAVIFFSVILTLVLRIYLKKRRRLQRKKISTISWPLSTKGSAAEVSATKPPFKDEYRSEVNAILAELRRSDDSHPSPGNRDHS